MKLKKSLIFAAAAAVVATVAYAMPAYSYDITYYTDASMTTEAGEGTLTCTGKFIMWSGTKTSYYTRSNEMPC